LRDVGPTARLIPISKKYTDEINAAEDQRYDAMTDEERNAYYLKPNWRTRLRTSVRGR
jgi:hypothetical protein